MEGREGADKAGLVSALNNNSKVVRYLHVSKLLLLNTIHTDVTQYSKKYYFKNKCGTSVQ